MNFGELLDRFDHFDGELFHVDWVDTPYSWLWDKDENTLTDEGRERFKTILESDFLIGSKGIYLTSGDITEDDYDLFLAACAGDVPSEDYDRWFR